MNKRRSKKLVIRDSKNRYINLCTDFQYELLASGRNKRSNTSAVAAGLSLGAAVLVGSFVLGFLWWRRRNAKQIFFDVNGTSTLPVSPC